MLKSSTPFRSLAVLLMLITSLFCNTHVTAQTAVMPQGAGTAASPYLISNWKELYWISQTSTSWDKQFKQTADIDLALAVPSIKTWKIDDGYGLSPIGNSTRTFSGKYDGGGYVINGLCIERFSNITEIALFGRTSATAEIHNLGITDATIYGSHYVGVLVGRHSGTITKCFSSGDVSGYNNSGGLVGYVDIGGRISNSFSRASVKNRSMLDSNCGGFAGYNNQGSISNCYSTGKASISSYNSTTNIGFVGGVWTGGSYAMSGNYWDTQTSGQTSTSTTASGKTTVEMKTQNTFTSWDFTDTWAIDPKINFGYPYPKNITTVQLHKPEVLINYALSSKDVIHVNGNLITVGKSTNAVCGFLIHTSENISLESGKHIAKQEIGEYTSFAEIGTSFTGLTANTSYYVCAYATNEYGTIYSPTVWIATTIQPTYLPIGVGTEESPYLISNWQELNWISQNPKVWGQHFLQTSNIDLAQAEPNIKTWSTNTGWTPIGNSSTIFSGTYSGGGYVINGLYINRSTTDGQALFGYTSTTAKINNLGVAEAEVSGNVSVGILVGSHSGNVSNCFTMGRVAATNNAGGFAGIVNTGGRISNSFSRATVSRLSGTNIFFGAFAGYNYQGSITNCYSTGRVSYFNGDTPTYKGFVGYANTFGSYAMSGNYWDTQTTRQTNTDGIASGKTSAQMKQQATFVGWDFTDNWVIDPQINAGYPYLKNISSDHLNKPEVHVNYALSSNDAINVIGDLITVGKSTNAVCGFLLNTTRFLSLESGEYIAKHEIGYYTAFTELGTLFSGLAANTDYYVCAYATNEYGTFYSPVVQIKTTIQPTYLPKGLGTETSPYLIANWQELNWISQNPLVWGRHFLQTADIDLAQAVPSIKTWNTNTGWTPIGNYTIKFSGNYDGGGYIINGLYISRTTTDYQALFGYTSATAEIKNLGVSAAEVTGDEYIGVLVGSLSGNISTCFTSGSLSAKGNAGGFAGDVNTGGRISNSFSRASVSRSSGTSTIFGGFAGCNTQGSITNCYSTGKVSYPTGTSPKDKGFVGSFYTGGSYAMSGNYWDTQTSGQSSTSGIASGKTTAEMQQLASFVGWDFTNTWAILQGINNGYPFLNFNKFVAGVINTKATNNSALVYAEVASLGKAENAEFGLLLNSSDKLSLSANGHIAKINLGKITATGVVSAKFENLASAAKYYVCTYAISGNDTTYGYAVPLITTKLPSSIPQGDGTVASPYLISNWQELYWISQNTTCWNKHLLQTADIDLTKAEPSIKTWDSNTGWTPIGYSSSEFSGKYDGGGYMINGLYIDRYYADNQALFGITSVTAEIKNLGVSEAEVTGERYVGVLVGNHSGNISNCFSSGRVSATYYAGGFAGYVYIGGRISNSFSRAFVSRRSGTYTDLGGFAGYNYKGSITNCYSTGSVSYTNGVSPTYSGFVPYVNTFGSYAMSGNYWDTQTSLQASTAGIASGKTSAEMKTQNTFASWDFTSTWAIDPLINAGYPYLKSINTAQLYKAEANLYEGKSTMDAIKVSGALITIGKSTSATCGFLINSSADINLTASGHIAKRELGAFAASTEIETLFTGLSANTQYFVCAYATNEHGTFYSPSISIKTTEQTSSIPHGAGTVASPYLISNWQELYWISQTSASWDKQFLQTADIDLALAVPSIKTWDRNAGWTPIGNNTTPFSGKYDGGGFTINGLYISRPRYYYQSLFGCTAATSEITKLGVTNVIIDGDSYIGVIVGGHSGSISNCYTSGSVAASNYAGGFAGYVLSSGRINNSFSSTSVTRSYGIDTSFGGFVGSNYQGSISNCYARGRISYATGTSPTNKGFAGTITTGSSYSMTSNYWDIQISEQLYTAGIATGKTTAEMQVQSTFTGWDFANVWAIDPLLNAGYPYLGKINTIQLSKAEVQINIVASAMNDVKVSGAIISIGKSSNTVCGFLINSTADINLSASGHIAKQELGVFTAASGIETLFTGLSANTQYYVCAYASNEHGVVYSRAMPITTLGQPSSVPQGAGTLASPYLISNWQELNWISQTSSIWNKHFRQTADISLAQAVPSIKTWDSNMGWTPIGNSSTNFTGVYDGNGHSISELYISRSNTSYQALFGYIGSTGRVTGLGVVSAYVKGYSYNGLLASYNYGTISSSYTSGSVYGLSNTGGFVSSNGGNIKNCYSMTSVYRSSGTNSSFGGFVGYNYGVVSKCYSTGNVVSNGFVGTTGTGYAMTSNFWDTQTSFCTGTGGTAGQYATGTTTVLMKTAGTFVSAGWDTTSIWVIHPSVNNGYPCLRNGKTFLLQDVVSVSSDNVRFSAQVLIGTTPVVSSGLLVATTAMPSLRDKTAQMRYDTGKQLSTASFIITFDKLLASTNYYARMYAIAGNDTVYSPQISFKTSELPTVMPQGKGSATSPYLISKWQELYWISQNNTSWDKQFLQTADIDLTQAVPSIITWDSDAGWMPIGSKISFAGVYNGNGFVISGLYINRPTSYYEGLFGYIGSTGAVSDLGLLDVNISADEYVGSLAGENHGKISRCFSSGALTGNSYCGSFVGNTSGGTIEDCYTRVSMAVINGYTYGGFVGYNYQGTVTRCYSAGMLDKKNSTATNVGFVGSANSTSMANNYWDIETSGQATTGGTLGQYATGLPTAGMKTQSNFTGWNFSAVWAIDPLINAGYPYLRNKTNNYAILKRAELALNSSVSTINSFDFTGSILTMGGSTSVSAHGFIVSTQPNMSVTPGGYLKIINLGTKSVTGGFNGSIAGLEADSLYYVCAFVTNQFGTSYSPVQKVYTLSIAPVAPQGSGDTENDPYRIQDLNHLYWIADQVNKQGRDFAGKYFLQVNDIDASETKNWRSGKGWEPIGSVNYVSTDLTASKYNKFFQANYNGAGTAITGLYVNSDAVAAGLFGAIGKSGSIRASSVTDAYISGESNTGILVGLNYGAVDSCSVSGMSRSADSHAGGLVGYNTGTITKSQSKSIVTANNVIDPTSNGRSSYSGGFVCENYGNIDQCISIGGTLGDSISGFVGTNGVTGSISNSYRRTNANSSYGFFRNNAEGAIINCYCVAGTTSITSGKSDYGFGSGSSVQGCFWDKEASGSTYDYSGAVGKTTAEMKSANTFIDAGWDFKGETTNGTKDIWVIHPRYNNGYPFLAWEAPKLSYLGGSVYYDRDKNNAFSQGDVALGGIKVELLPEGTITGTARDGSYLFYTAPGDYTVRVIPNDPFYKGSDALDIPVSVKFLEDTVSAPIGLYGTDVYDFSLNMVTVWTRCASKVPVWAIVQNKSILPTNIALNINLDSRVTLVSSTVPQDSTGSDGKKYFRLANMQPFESRVVELTVSVPAASTDSISYSSSIQHQGKVVATDDIRSVIRCSYDPNDVQVIPGGLTENGYVPMGQELTYLVRFQNTGNDTAFMVDILDTLAPSLDPLSFEMLASSHAMRYFIERNGALRFLFEDINLEDSTSNEPASHGFVLFKVKPRTTVTTGTRVGLTAHIYFDYNPAVVTNTAVTTFTDQYTKVAQSIDLTEGWNLVSFYVQPGDNAIENALSSCIADIEAVKTGDAFYSAGQADWLNSLKTINGGQAYLIKAKRDTKLTVNGLLVFKPFEHKLNKGWNMVGCPVKTDVAVDPMLKNKPVTEAKDFEGFWRPTTPAGNMINFEPGKGYFIYSDQPAVLPW